MCQSEVALLRERIATEYEAMKRGLNGLASGQAQHAFIDARMRRVDNYHEQLTHHVSDTEATTIICDLYTQVIG
ncbi:hypothetical protein KDA_28760 [Dictyobacter alpinus]|uniref:Uncharacterized protein n=1 Tax=Dictyobacter alpinus TaxID=2014873 RepID=A0A402B7V2_9CHLR|nr:hypothetical protein [Dictyobacter alpinus]GCE27392.1 hypothetical protein KDA_28760 [Dictyobacter alpinus]